MNYNENDVIEIARHYSRVIETLAEFELRKKQFPKSEDEVLFIKKKVDESRYHLKRAIEEYKKTVPENIQLKLLPNLETIEDYLAD